MSVLRSGLRFNAFGVGGRMAVRGSTGICGPLRYRRSSGVARAWTGLNGCWRNRVCEPVFCGTADYRCTQFATKAMVASGELGDTGRIGRKRRHQCKHGLFRYSTRTVNDQPKQKVRHAVPPAEQSPGLSLYSWGTGNSGELGHGAITRNGILTNNYVESSPRLIEALEGIGVVDVSCGYRHSMVITKTGDVLTWGSNKYSQLGHDAATPCLLPTKVEGLDGLTVVHASAGGRHCAVLTEDGDLYTWGYGGGINGCGALGLGDKETRKRPERVFIGGSDEVKLQSIASGSVHMLGLGLDGEVWSWGRGEFGRLGNGSSENQPEPEPVELFLEMDVVCTQIACGDAFCLALTNEGLLYAWGKNDQGQLGLGGGLAMDVYSLSEYPTLVESLADERIVEISAGSSHALAVTEKGEVYFWGMRLWMEPHKMTALSGHRIVQTACGHGFSLALSDAGQLFSWGKGLFVAWGGCMGHGDSGRHAQPEEIKALSQTSIQLVRAGSRHSIALTGKPTEHLRTYQPVYQEN